ncbi:MAG TPA: response regulator [Chloroflexota bacterium]|jgi:signal transduction histidine kinase/DNA-binding response OmpR family regulator|nr:response regulator [Chloroflexota bacterium]
MDALRAVQLVTDLAYLLLGIAAIGEALRSHERARVDVAILFGALAGTVALQEIQLLSCFGPAGCLDLPWSTQLTTVLILVLPYALLRLVDDIADVPIWQMRLSLTLLVVLAAASVISPAPAGAWLVAVLTAYLIVGTAHAAWAFARLARSTAGITRRRMAAVAWGCALLAATLVLAVLAPATGADEFLFLALSRLAGLISGLSFWAGFFPPNWLSQTWRLPELLGYLRPTRLMATPSGQPVAASDAMAIDRLCVATAATTGAQRVFLILEDAVRHDLYLWGAPSARMDAYGGSIGRVLASNGPLVLRDVQPKQLPPAVVAAFGSESLPSTALLVPVALDGKNVGVLAAFAEKGPMFVEDDLEVVSFFAAEAAAILRIQRYRESVNELEALREADRLKDEFMAVVSHELRTPLTAISGYSDILLRKLSGPLNERQERQVVGVRDASRRLLALINDLLDVSKLEAGTLDLRLAALDPQQVMARSANALRVIASSKGISIEERQSDTKLPPVLADDERLQQILTNLLTNAIKFTPQGGSIWLAARVNDGPNGREIAFLVHDTGIGLAPGQVTRVWDRFYQAESSSTRRFGGAGLGLSIVRRLAELHGGRVEASSAGIDQGSTFTLYLPVAVDAQAAALPVGVAPPPVDVALPGGVTADVDSDLPLVLVVEDDAHIATVLRTYLEADGYRVEHADDGHEALQLARSLQPFAITLDISLPKLDGWSVLNALKREPATAEIPVVIVSIVDNRNFGMVLGATEYLVKPIDHERLRTVLAGLDGLRAERDGSSSVLVVDDDPALRDVLGSLLSEDGWRVTTAGDGAAALAAVEQEKPTAMVLDLMMPRVDGFEVLQTLRSHATTRDLPVIVVTAKDLTDEDRDRLARSAERVILKQALRVDDLRQEIRGLLSAHRARGNGQQNGGAAAP